jgi:hypothetical protein
MPNWTSNMIYAEGSPEQISEFLEKIRGARGVLDFDSIIPMPELLKHTGSGARAFGGEDCREWYVIEPADYSNDKPEKIRLFTAEEEAELTKLGVRSWYDWSIANWGTKWNACRADIVSGGQPDSGYVRIEFETAWDAPEPIFRKLAEMFPFLDITCKWRHEDEDPYPHKLEFPAKETAGAA